MPHDPSTPTVTVTLRAAAWLPDNPNEAIRKSAVDQKPYWDIERARIGDGRQVLVEILVNGKAVATEKITADGTANDLKFDVPIKESSWIAARVMFAAHTNPVFALVEGKPIRASKASAEWCLNAVEQCWTQKSPRISEKERPEAKKAYDHARETYRRLIGETRP